MPHKIEPTTPHLRQAEAAALTMTVEELEELELYRSDDREATMRGIAIWELRMRREGASESAIEAKRAELRRQMEKALRQ